MASRDYSEKTLKLLFNRAAFCAFPGCFTPLTDRVDGSNVVVGHVAHIAGLNPGSARYDAAMTDSARNGYENLLLLCPTHHLAYVDAAPDAHTPEQLRVWKREQERWLADRKREAMPAVGFAELEVVMKAVAGGAPTTPSRDLTVVPPAAKMQKNGLTGASGIAMGLTKAPDVRELLQKLAELAPTFPDRLRAGFVAEYARRHAEGERGDELFLGLRSFAARSRHDLVAQDAALAVLSYLFEACEVFER